MIRPPRALLFDLDGTLLDEQGQQDAVARTCRVVAAEYPGIDAETLLAANGIVWRSYWPEVEDAWMRGRLDSAAVSFEAWRRTLGARGVADDAVARFAQETLSREERAAHRLYDDALPVLMGLNGRLALAAITNGATDTQREKLRTTRIEGLFTVVAISGEVGVAKPDPRIFQHALDGLGVAAEDAWHIGDSLRNDVGGAAAMGITSVWLNRSGTPRRPEDPAPDIEILSLAELDDHLGRRGS